MNRSSNLARLGIVLAALSLATLGAAVAAEPGPQKIGEYESASIETPRPYPVSFGQDAREWTVRYDGATYIRVHFVDFDLADGDAVEIFDPAGRRHQVYTGQGPHGTGEFWAHTLPGDTAIIRMNATVGGNSGFRIDGYGRGIEQVFDLSDVSGGEGGELPGGEPSPESVCGSQDWQDVECYSGSYPTEYDHARAAVKAVIGCCSACTAFKVSDSGQFLTNNHCTSSQSGVQQTELLINYKAATCNGAAGTESSVMGSSLVATDYTLDYTLMTTTGSSGSIPCLTLSAAQVANGEEMYIAHHPSGGPKKLSIVSDQNGGSRCIVRDNALYGRAPGSDVGYYCDTIGGSSGSPVLSAVSHQVIALHHYGGCLNSGARSDLIVDQIGPLIDTCSGGGGGECGNGVAEPGEDCDGADLGGETCQSLGFDGGTLGCSASCSYDTTGCTTNQPPECGNGIRESGEECDGADFGGDTCTDYGFDGGTLSCKNNCTVQTRECTGGGGGGGGGGTCTDLLPSGSSCTLDGQCCSGKCKGKPGQQTCN